MVKTEREREREIDEGIMTSGERQKRKGNENPLTKFSALLFEAFHVSLIPFPLSLSLSVSTQQKNPSLSLYLQKGEDTDRGGGGRQ